MTKQAKTKRSVGAGERLLLGALEAARRVHHPVAHAEGRPSLRAARRSVSRLRGAGGFDNDFGGGAPGAARPGRRSRWAALVVPGLGSELRRVANVVFAAAQVVASGLAGAGLLGERTVGEISDEYPTLVVPAGYAFAIWGPIFLLCLAYAVYQALPAQRENSLLRRIGWWTALAFAGNALWIVAFQAERFLLAWATIVFILLSLAGAFIGIIRLGGSPDGAERWFVEAPIGVFFGWITAANVANAAQVLVARGWDGWGLLSEVRWSVALLLLGGLFASLVTATSGSTAYALAISWALAAIAANQLGGSAAVAVTAGALAVLIVALLAATRTVRRRKGRRPAKRPEGKPLSS